MPVFRFKRATVRISVVAQAWPSDDADEPREYYFTLPFEAVEEAVRKWLYEEMGVELEQLEDLDIEAEGQGVQARLSYRLGTWEAEVEVSDEAYQALRKAAREKLEKAVEMLREATRLLENIDVIEGGGE